MSHIRWLSGVICLALVGALLGACGRQAAPIPAPPTSPPTPVAPTPTKGPQIVSRDFSDFTDFSYAQIAGSCGFLCPELGIFEAEISRRPSGDYLLRASIAERGISGVDQCIDDSSQRCIAIVQLPERPLAPTEADAVLDAFREVEILLYTPFQVWCECTCLGSYFRWDSYSMLVKDCWDYPRFLGSWESPRGVAGDQVLMGLLDQLAIRSRGGLLTATPLARRCVTYDIFPTYIWDIEIAADHTVWIASGIGAARFDRVRESWITYTTEQDLPSDRVRTVTIAEDSSVWLTFWDEVGVSHYDGERWEVYTITDGLPSNEVFDVAVGADGAVWFATAEGVSRWESSTDRWESYHDEEGMVDYRVLRIQIASDGSLWLSGYEHATHLIFDSDTGEPAWKNYDRNSARTIVAGSVYFDDLTVAPDGKVWADSGGGIILLDPESGRWSKSSCCHWSVSAFSLTDNGGLWVGNNYDGVDFVPQATSGEADAMILLHYDVDDGLASNDVRSIAVESDEVVWVGTDKGVSRCETGQ